MTKVSVREVNPDSTVLQQLDQQWQKIAAVLVWKLARSGVTISGDDFEKFAQEGDAGQAVLFTHGHKDSIELSIVTAERARALAEYDAQQRGTS